MRDTTPFFTKQVNCVHRAYDNMKMTLHHLLNIQTMHLPLTPMWSVLKFQPTGEDMLN
jgi:hypothetical protein